MPVTILVRKTGAYFISPEDAAEVRLVDHEGNEIATTPGKGIALCRCGASQRMPFCDASHKRVGFMVEDAACAPAPAPAAPPADPAPGSAPQG